MNSRSTLLRIVYGPEQVRRNAASYSLNLRCHAAVNYRRDEERDYRLNTQCGTNYTLGISLCNSDRRTACGHSGGLTVQNVSGPL